MSKLPADKSEPPEEKSVAHAAQESPVQDDEQAKKLVYEKPKLRKYGQIDHMAAYGAE